MDKQKHIEEMSKDIKEIAADWTVSCEYSCDSCPYGNCRGKIATFLVNAGYRKIPENAVVLTVTKAEEHFVDLLTEFDEMCFHPETTVPCPMVYADEWKRRMLYAIGQLRKETAEKFAERLKEKMHKGKALHTPVVGKEYVQRIIREVVDEICKKITEVE